MKTRFKKFRSKILSSNKLTMKFLLAEAQEHARKKYPHFDLFKPLMLKIAQDDKSPIDWNRSIDQIYGDLYWLAVAGGKKYGD